MSSTPTYLTKANDKGCSDRKLIKCLTGSADDLSSLLACTHYLPVGLRVWAPPRRSLVRKLGKTSSSALWPGLIVTCGVRISRLTQTRSARGDGPRPPCS